MHHSVDQGGVLESGPLDISYGPDSDQQCGLEPQLLLPNYNTSVEP